MNEDVSYDDNYHRNQENYSNLRWVIQSQLYQFKCAICTNLEYAFFTHIFLCSIKLLYKQWLCYWMSVPEGDTEEKKKK